MGKPMIRSQSIKIVLIALSCVILSHNSLADVFDVSLNNEVAEFAYQPWGDVDVESDNGGPELGLLFNEDGDWMLSGKLLVASANSAGLQLSPGIKLNLINADDIDSDINVAFALGGRASGLLPTALPLRAFGELFYSPSITSFNDLESVLETEIGIEYQAATNASVYLGYRRVNIDVDGIKKDLKLDEKIHIGLKFNF